MKQRSERWIFLVFGLVCLIEWRPLDAELPGQIITDSEHRRFLKRVGGGHVFICGPGDPEGFLYRGELQADGTRTGDQNEIIQKLIHYGGNSLYIQAVRSHGGDGTWDHNPFINHDPAQGINERVLGQWESWLSLMDDHGILIYFFIYDDSARVWDTGDEVVEDEERFVSGLVNRFKHHRHLIWVVAEESEEAFSKSRSEALAKVIERTDENSHLIGNHHHSGTVFKSFSFEGPFRHFSMQLNIPQDQVYTQTIEAIEQARGYQLVYAENTETNQSVEGWRRFAWSVSMAGAMPMMLGMDVASTPISALQQCRFLSDFFEDTDFYLMQPAMDMGSGSIQAVLHNPGKSFIAWADGEARREKAIVHRLNAGEYDLLWLDCQSGRRVDTRQNLSTSPSELVKPESIGIEWAVYGEMANDHLAQDGVFPGEEWEQRRPEEAGVSLDALQHFSQLVGGRGCVVRDGYLIYSWGDISRSSDIASAGKPFYSHLLFRAIETGLLESADDFVLPFQPCLNDLNAHLGYKDRLLTFRHLAFQTACLGYDDPPGSAFDYNDQSMGFFWDTLVNGVFDIPWKDASAQLFGPELTGPLRFQDAFTFPIEGRMRGRIAISPRDFARLGLLYLNWGRWDGRQIVSPRHVKWACGDPLSLNIPRTMGREAQNCEMRSIGGGGNQTDHNGGYSWLWWINGLARDGRRWWYDAPEDMYAALGHCGRRGLAVLPAEQIVVSWNDGQEIHCKRELGNEAFRVLRNAVMAPEAR